MIPVNYHPFILKEGDHFDCPNCREQLNEGEEILAHEGQGNLHPIHGSCIRDWIILNLKFPSCPVCKIMINSTSLKLYSKSWKIVDLNHFRPNIPLFAAGYASLLSIACRTGVEIVASQPHGHFPSNRLFAHGLSSALAFFSSLLCTDNLGRPEHEGCQNGLRVCAIVGQMLGASTVFQSICILVPYIIEHDVADLDSIGGSAIGIGCAAIFCGFTTAKVVKSLFQVFRENMADEY